MTEINITRIIQARCADCYGSVAQYGENAAQHTWRKACMVAQETQCLDTPEKRQALRDHLEGFGAWDKAEIATWSDVELEAILVQLVTAEGFEGDECRVYKCDIKDHDQYGQWFYYAGE